MGFQSRPQGHRPAVLFPRAHRGFRRHVSLPADEDPSHLADSGPALAGRDQTRNLSQPGNHARDDHGVFRADYRAPGRLRQLFPTHTNRRARHGVPRPEHAFVLDDVRRLCRDADSLFCSRWSASSRLDRVRAAECAPIRRARSGSGRGPLDHQHRDFLHRVAHGRSQFYYHYARHARQGHEPDAHASNLLVVVHHRHPGLAGVWSSALGWHSSAHGPQHRYQLLSAARHH